MRLIHIITILVPLLTFVTKSQAKTSSEYKEESIGKKVKEFKPDSINLATPIDYYLSRAWVMLTGKEGLWNDISTSKFSFPQNDVDVDENFRSYVLNENIDAIITYRDSVAAIVTHNDGEDLMLLNYCWIENGKWVNGGQGLAEDIGDAHSKLRFQLPAHYKNLPRIPIVKKLPESVEPFAYYLSHVSTTPEQ